MASQNIPRSNSKQKHSLFALLPLQLLWLAFFCLLFVASTQPAALFQKRSNLFQVISFWVSAHGVTNIQIDRQVQWFSWHHLHYGLKLPLVWRPCSIWFPQVFLWNSGYVFLYGKKIIWQGFFYKKRKLHFKGPTTCLKSSISQYNLKIVFQKLFSFLSSK